MLNSLQLFLVWRSNMGVPLFGYQIIDSSIVVVGGFWYYSELIKCHSYRQQDIIYAINLMGWSSATFDASSSLKLWKANFLPLSWMIFSFIFILAVNWKPWSWMSSISWKYLLVASSPCLTTISRDTIGGDSHSSQVSFSVMIECGSSIIWLPDRFKYCSCCRFLILFRTDGMPELIKCCKYAMRFSNPVQWITMRTWRIPSVTLLQPPKSSLFNFLLNFLAMTDIPTSVTLLHPLKLNFFNCGHRCAIQGRALSVRAVHQ